MVDIFAQRSFAKTAGLYGYDDCGGNNCLCLDGRHDDPQRRLWCFCCTCILLCVAMYPQWCTMYSYDHIVCWVIILGLTCRVEIPRLGICFITVLTRLCLSTLVLVNARGVNPILVIYSISICQWWCIPAGAEQIADQIEMEIWKFVCCHFVSSGILIIQILH